MKFIYIGCGIISCGFLYKKFYAKKNIYVEEMKREILPGAPQEIDISKIPKDILESVKPKKKLIRATVQVVNGTIYRLYFDGDDFEYMVYVDLNNNIEIKKHLID